jgi:putative phage-type endonuclease
MFATPASLKKDYKQQYSGTVLKNAAIDRAYLQVRANFTNDNECVSSILNMCQLITDIPISETCVYERFKTLDLQRNQVIALRSIPVIEQRSPAWYEARARVVTASSLAQALGLGKYKSQKDLIVEKCGYKEVPFISAPPLIWGCKYEPVAATIYTRRNKATLYDFGLIAHPHVSFFGASPDGITDIGTMLEIKCPYRRKTTGEIPQEYFYQIQGQLDVCDLNECDYIECQFEEYNGFQSFAADGNEYSANMCEKGVFLEYKIAVSSIETKTTYLYGPSNVSTEIIDKWTTEEMTRLYNIEGIEYVKATYWKLAEYMCKRVFRDHAFMNARYAELEHVWNKIQMYRQSRELYDREIDPPTAASPSVKTISIRSRTKTSANSVTDTPVNVFNIDTSKATTTDPSLTSYAFKLRENDVCW